jgi:amidase
MARSAEDLALALDIVSGANHLNAPGWKLDLPEPRSRSLKNFRVALWADDEIAPVDSEISKRVLEIGERLSRLGAKVSEAARPGFSPKDAHETYLNLLMSFMASRVTDEQFQQNQERAASLSPDDQSLAAIEARASVLDHRSWLRFNNHRAILRRQWQEFFRDWDIVLCPTLSTTAFKHDHRPIPERTLQINGNEVPYFQQIFWAGLATVSHLPSTVFPTGLSGTGLPIGLQAIGGEYHDRTTIEFARLMAQEIGGFQPPPGFED